MTDTIIPLKKGIEIEHACKTYTHKTGIPEKIHKEIYGNLVKDGEGKTDAKESKKIYDKKLSKHVPEKEEDDKKPVKDEPTKPGK